MRLPLVLFGAALLAPAVCLADEWPPAGVYAGGDAGLEAAWHCLLARQLRLEIESEATIDTMELARPGDPSRGQGCTRVERRVAQLADGLYGAVIGAEASAAKAENRIAELEARVAARDGAVPAAVLQVEAEPTQASGVGISEIVGSGLVGLGVGVAVAGLGLSDPAQRTAALTIGASSAGLGVAVVLLDVISGIFTD